MKFDPAPLNWKDNDTMLYGVGVGCSPDDGLEFIYETMGPAVLPTYCVIPGMSALAGLGKNVELNIMALLHGEQSIELYRPIPTEVKDGVAEAEIVEVWDKGKAAVIGVSCTVSDQDGPIAINHSRIWVRGAGGFGGDKGPSTEGVNTPPARDPDHVVTYQTLPQQGAIYRLSGDRVPLHIDPALAKMAGYDKPFMHGLCTYGFAGRALLGALCNNRVERFTSMTGRFANIVQFGDDVITKIWITGPGEAIFQTETQTGSVAISQGCVSFVEKQKSRQAA